MTNTVELTTAVAEGTAEVVALENSTTLELETAELVDAVVMVGTGSDEATAEDGMAEPEMLVAETAIYLFRVLALFLTTGIMFFAICIAFIPLRPAACHRADMVHAKETVLVYSGHTS